MSQFKWELCVGQTIKPQNKTLLKLTFNTELNRIKNALIYLKNSLKVVLEKSYISGLI
jgi:hypothetical protein